MNCPKTWLTKTFKIKYPIIMAPMFLVSSEQMLIAAAESGITGCIPALNYRSPDQFREGLRNLKENCPGAFGVNLIVNKSNIYLEEQIKACEDFPPNYIITSLGSPRDVIKRLKHKGVKIICDVVDVQYAFKVQELGADAIIAVNSGAGGHAGPAPASILVPNLIKKCSLPVITAGGIGTGEGLLSAIALGAQGASIGSPFIATHESPVTEDYKDAVVKYQAKDIALTSKISGTPCTVIKTPYVEKIGLDQNPVEKLLNKNKTLKKYAKMLVFKKGMGILEKAAFSATYKSIWCAGPSIEFVERKESIEDFISRLMSQYTEALTKLKEKHDS